MKIVWLPESDVWAVEIREADAAAHEPDVEVARFSTLHQAEQWWLAEGHDLYGHAL